MIAGIKKIDENVWEIPRDEGMRVPGRIYATKKMLEQIEKDNALKQVRNVATLPGIVGYSIAMPDIHWGYGFPIGGVAAMDLNQGVISPGGVGYDINCGVRMIATALMTEDVKKKIQVLVSTLFARIPTGVGSSGAIKKLSRAELQKVLIKGASWAVEQGYGSPEDLARIEEQGRMEGANPDFVSERAYKRGADQLGTLGSGNHFLEIAQVVKVYDQQVADALGLYQGQIVLLVHTGSRGLGYQVCDDSLKIVQSATRKYGISLPDRQLASAPLSSPEGKRYFAMMCAAANFAFANRQIISALAEEAFMQALGISPSQAGFRLIYDIAHNIAKIEEHEVKRKRQQVCVHRKGATRAFPPGHPALPDEYRDIGQPVIIPGSMGTASYLCVGTEKSMLESFGSSCHGAGRVMSRHESKRASRGRDLVKEMTGLGVQVMAHGRGTLAEEMPYAYKDVSDVVNVMADSGLLKKVVRCEPLGVIKG